VIKLLHLKSNTSAQIKVNSAPLRRRITFQTQEFNYGIIFDFFF